MNMIFTLSINFIQRT